MSTTEKVGHRFEPEAVEHFGEEYAIQASIAISLKRIADAMTAPTNEWGETMAEAVGGNIRRACMDISSIVHNAMNSGRR